MFDDDMLGTPDVQADFCEQQIFDDNCAVVAETSIINQFRPDLNLDQETAAYISASNGWYHPGEGTSPDVIGNMMDKFGIDNHTNSCATAADLAWELQQGHGVIVGVNSSELWDQGPLADLTHAICKAAGLDNPSFMPADHAVTVTGIDLSDPDHPMAIINDSGVGATVQYPLDKFIDAWENSGCRYVATNDPLPAMQGVGDSLGEFWGNWQSKDILSDAAGLVAGGVTGWVTGDMTLATQLGMATQKIVSSVLDDEDFSRLI